MKSSVFSFAASLALQYIGAAQAGVITPLSPTVSIKNGTVHGIKDYVWNQDYFLGIPYARPPVGPLRFRPPQHINTKLGNIQAKKYGVHCFGFGWDQDGFEQSEDCLTLNIFRPAGISSNAKLPVAIWIHGGGFMGGGAPDPRYNMTWMVDQSAQIGSPIIGVTINYRLSGWGFLAGSEVEGTQNLNAGLKDQRLAMHWVKENIRAFGGDPAKVTIFGESAGGTSIGLQQIAFNGRDDGLFRGAIQQSGSAISWGPTSSPKDFQEDFDAVVAAASCADQPSPLNCLRNAPAATLNAVFADQWWQPVIDGQFLTEYGSQALKNGRYVKVPTIVGTTSDEGASFGTIGANNDTDIANYFAGASKWSSATIQELLTLYPADVSIPPAENFTGQDDGTSINGAAYHRAAAFVGDFMFIANRRHTAEILSSQGVPVWSFRFRALCNGIEAYEGAGHFSEVGFVFHNLNGEGYVGPYDNGNPLGGPKAAEYAGLADFMSRSWIRFIAHRDPRVGTSSSDLKWVPYGHGAGKRQIVFDIISTGGSYIETDDYRQEGIAFMNEYALQTHR
ncbi:uncharacterized protein DFL_009180 [Arthrobotrys flagrans]|uniref:Carboxylic ester hydrolase n=1 Tax=Arthrobotrys flagrans TaxID=97331 RepID=A0A436ZR81_ARTFL|nr:hypothetical protein DFL_009180 [Arthrobotrys flagrans]